MQLAAGHQDMESGHAFNIASLARSRFHSGDFRGAYSDYVNAFTLQPRAWWLALEALRCLRKQSGTALDTNDTGFSLIFSPNYQGNSYQANLYHSAQSFGYKITPIHTPTVDSVLGIAARNWRRLVFHQHWLRDIYWEANTYEEGVCSIDRHMGLLLALKANGAIICWTLHNLIDHDPTNLQRSLCDYAIKRIINVSTCIFSHTKGSERILSDYCNYDLSKKTVVLEHPLYDSLRAAGTVPKEINTSTLKGKRVFLSMGMLRPYKGIPDLLTAFEAFMSRIPVRMTHLIVAGQISDVKIKQKLLQINGSLLDSITIIDRKLTDQEMVGLINISDVSVTPYKKILTSGSFFLSSTFGLPTIAPTIGAFPEIIEDKITGFLYDGSIPALVDKLENVMLLNKSDLKKIGLQARQRLSSNTIVNISNRFFSTLNASF